MNHFKSLLSDAAVNILSFVIMLIYLRADSYCSGLVTRCEQLYCHAA